MDETQEQPQLSPLNPGLGRKFWLQWVLGNSLGFGVGLGMPILLADLVSSQSHNVEIASYVTASILSFGIWVGVLQWIVLRTLIPISMRWILVAALTPGLSMVLVIPLFSISKPLLVLVLVIYPLLLSLGQGMILRQTLQPVWRWSISSFIGTVLGEVIGALVGVVCSFGLAQPGLSTLIGGFIGGAIYGFTTAVGFNNLVRQDHILPVADKSSVPDAPPNYRPWKYQIISFLCLFVVVRSWLFVFPAFPTSASSGSISPPWMPWFMIAGSLIYAYFSILIHELGHLLLALLNGYDLKACAVGRFALVRTGKRMKLFRTHRQFAGGFVLPVPRSLTRLRKRVFMMILGGPLASFLLFCLGSSPLLFARNWVANDYAGWWITFAAVYNLYIAVFNSLPLRIGYLTTDGGRLLDLARNTPQGQRFMAFYGYNASLRQGIRPRDIDPLIIQRSLAIPEQSKDHVSALLIAYHVALDQGDIHTAGQYLDQALALNLYYPGLFRGSLLLEGVYFEAYIRHQPGIARQWLEQIQDTALIEPYSLLRAEAALLLAEGDREAALVKTEQGLASAQKNQFMQGAALAEMEWLRVLMQAV